MADRLQLSCTPVATVQTADRAYARRVPPHRLSAPSAGSMTRTKKSPFTNCAIFFGNDIISVGPGEANFAAWKF